MRRHILGIAAAAALACAHGTAAAQYATAPLRPDSAAETVLPVGTRVRVTQSTVRPHFLVGSLRLADSATLTVQTRAARDAVTLPYAAVENVEVSQGFRTGGERVAHGAGVGLLTGVVVTAVLFGFGAAADAGDGCNDCFLNGKAAALFVGIPLTGVTTLAGAILGAGGRGERWSTVRTPIRTAPRDTAIATAR